MPCYKLVYKRLDVLKKIHYYSSMYKEFSGIDEAALGPILGPYTCSVVTFSVQENKELFNIFSELQSIKIGDSKKLYTSGKSIKKLENTALSFAASFLKYIPGTLYEFIRDLIIEPSHLDEIMKIPWFKDIDKLQIPQVCELEHIKNNKQNLDNFLSDKKLAIKNINIDIVPAKKFNHFLSQNLNKSQTCQKIISPLMYKSLNNHSRIIIDRQGGRKFYGEWLIDLFPNYSISVERETKDLSTYNLDESQIRFQVKGDDKYLETALASIFSKYIRELMMLSFNQYWKRSNPQLKGTAGYPLDGKRFIQDLKKMNLLFDEKLLIRQK